MTKKDKEISSSNLRLLECVRTGLNPILTHSIPSEAVRLVKLAYVYQASDLERYTLTQLVRSVGSIGANYVEGLARASPQDTLRFLRIARGSAYESCYHALCLSGFLAPELQDLSNTLDAYIDSYIVYITNSAIESAS